MKPTRYLALVYVLPLPLSLAMWFKGTPIAGEVTVEEIGSLLLVVCATGVAGVAIPRALGSMYEIRGRRAGLLVAMSGILGYLAGSLLQSEVVHVLSIMAFYFGTVLYFGGAATLIPVLPGAFIVLSFFVIGGLRPWGLAYVDAISWVAIVGSSVLLINSRRSPEPPGCGRCSTFRLSGEIFCLSCGRLLGRVSIASRRRGMVGLTAFSVVILSLLTLTAPLLIFQPSPSLVNIGLGGAQDGGPFAPLSGWGARAHPLMLKGGLVQGYDLTKRTTQILALVESSGSSGIASSDLAAYRGNSSTVSPIPPSLASEMTGYAVSQNGTAYVGLQGVFHVGALNNSQVFPTFLAVDLRQASSSFQADNGSALYGAAGAIVGWTKASGQWIPTAGILLSTFTSFSQMAYVISPTIVVAILFTIASDDDRSKARRLESAQSLTRTESIVLQAFGSAHSPLTGGVLLERAKKMAPSITDDSFFASLNETSRRGLVSGSVTVRNGRPTLLWKSLVV